MLKAIYWKHYLKRGKGIFAFSPFSCGFGHKERSQEEADFRKGWLHGASLLSHGRASEVPGASKARVSQRGQQRGCGSPHTAWLSWGRKARWEKRLQCRWKKGITASEETAVYQMAFQRARVRILTLKKFRGRVRACSCWPREQTPPTCSQTCDETRQSEKWTLRRIW